LCLYQKKSFKTNDNLNIKLGALVRVLEREGLTLDGHLTDKGIKYMNELVSDKKQVIIEPSFIRKYLDLFPSVKLPSGKLARCSEKNLIPAFRWFFDNNDYTEDVILAATDKYVEEYRMKSYKYMQTSQYFIRKQQSDKSWSSELANYCEFIMNGDEGIETFKDTVV
jgi:hypothetical protein